MLTLQAGVHPELGQRLKEASSRIMAIGRAHDLLYRSTQIEKIDIADYLSDVCRDLEKATPNCKVGFEASGSLLLNTDRAVSVALVVTELVTNAAKHAYPEGEGGPIRVRLRCGDGEVTRVSVSDEGVGLPPDFEINGKARTGLGMRLVRALANQAGAQLRFEWGARGTEFVLEIPVSTEATPER
jgi:two-component sensor histidine kinase